MHMRTLPAAITFILALAGTAIAADDDLLTMLDTDRDGRVSAAEFTASPGKTRREFDRIDRDRDGYATAAELSAYAKMKQATSESEEEGR